MSKDEYIDKLEDIEEALFNYNVDYFIQKVIELLEKIEKQEDILDNNKKNAFVLSFNNIFLAMQKKDYLLMYDILKFELPNYL